MTEGGAPEAFHVALREAIAARGISLDQLRRSLARQGVTVSGATLSYWQSGRSRPERATSLAAIGPLEECLDLPRGFLASRLPTVRRPGTEGQPYTQGVLPVERSDGRGYIDTAVAQLGLCYDDATWVAVHDSLRYDSARREVAHDVRMLIRAERDGLDRYPVWLESPEGGAIPVVSAGTGCRRGCVREFAEYSGVAVEMVLDRPLRSGETTLVEHRLQFLGLQRPSEGSWRRVASASREVVMELRFDGTPPSDCRAEFTACGGRVQKRRIVAGPVVQAHFLDHPPGVFQVRWTT